ncbi:MAG: hypothetical protein OSB43_04650 [Nocardioides sp.]|uniref:hypothetical protein n=1 Tax=Nocardioides sp. TaxID=35761 RepID=UPI002385153C|nr:hypothetical protein [Nocardioides sp.]MDE0775548.1 hypothetical protein [Nocardioides sp.]
MTHPSNPSWAKRWQAKLDAAPTPKDRAAEAWSLVLAVAARCESPIGEGAFSELADTLVDLANNMWPPKPAPPAVQAHDVYDSRGNFLYRYDPADFA